MRQANEWEKLNSSFSLCLASEIRISLEEIFPSVNPTSFKVSESYVYRRESLIHRTGIIHRKTNFERINQLTENPSTSSTLQCQLFFFSSRSVQKRQREKTRRRMEKANNNWMYDVIQEWSVRRLGESWGDKIFEKKSVLCASLCFFSVKNVWTLNISKTIFLDRKSQKRISTHSLSAWWYWKMCFVL